MIEIASRHNCPAKLPGSGGAVIGLYPDEAIYEKLLEAYNEKGYSCIKVEWDDSVERGIDIGR